MSSLHFFKWMTIKSIPFALVVYVYLFLQLYVFPY